MARKIVFWFEFASTYSYLSAMRIDQIAQERGVAVAWKPFLLGPLFRKQGWETSPFNIYEAKGRNMWRDMERKCETYGLSLHPGFKSGAAPFPQNSLLAARVAVGALQKDWGRPFCRKVFQEQFARGRDISDPNVVASCAQAAGGDARTALEEAGTEARKQALKDNVAAAEALGLYGAPSFTVGDELFWGDDRLEDALEWALR